MESHNQGGRTYRIEQRGHEGRKQGPERQSRHNAAHGQGEHDRQIGPGHDPGRRAQTFHGRYGAGASVQIGGHGLGDADAAEEQGRESDQPHDGGQAVHDPRQAGLGAGSVPDPPAGFGKAFAQFPGHGGGHARRQLEPVGVAGDESRSGQARGGQLGAGNQDRRPEAGGQTRRGVGFARKHRPDDKLGVGQPDALADFCSEPVEQLRGDRRSGQAVLLGQHRVQGQRRNEDHLSVEGVGCVHGAQRGQGWFGAGGVAPGHDAQGEDMGDVPPGGEGGQFVDAGRAQGQGDLHIAAEQGRGVPNQTRVVGGGQAFHPGHGRHAEGQATQKDAKSSQPGA
jgi:hypothetical protein